MASWIYFHAAPLLATAAILSLMCIIFMKESAGHRWRMHALKGADRLLARHLELIQGLIEDTRVSDDLKRKILWFSEAIVDDAVFLEIWTKACEDASSARRPKELNAYQKDVALLYSIDPDLGNCMESAVSSALQGMLLKLPKALERLADYEARIAANSRSGSYVFESAVERTRTKRSFDGDGFQGALRA